MVRSRQSVILTFLCASLFAAAGPAARAGTPVTTEFRDFYLSSRALPMGNAYTAIVEGEDSIFLNPAGLGAKRFSINYASLYFEATQDLALNVFQYVVSPPNLNADTINGYMGKNMYGRMQFSPTIQMGNLGFGLLVDSQFALYAKNQALPQIIFGQQQTNGVQVAYGTSLRRGRGEGKDDLRVGIGTKVMWRRGGYHLLPLTTLFSLSNETLNQLNGSYERGIGIDAGAQYVYKFNSKLNASAGLAWTDIGGMTFPSADDQPGNLAFGVAGSYDLGKLRATLAYDLHYLTTSGDSRKKSHVGLALTMPLLSIYGGYNQVSLSYGATVDIWLLKFTAASYAEELATLASQDSSRRYSLQVGLKVPL